jgi:phosphoenolpyruvate carboxylase
VEDEIRDGLYYFRESLFEAIPRIYHQPKKAIRRGYVDSGNVISTPGVQIQSVYPQTTAMAGSAQRRGI